MMGLLPALAVAQVADMTGVLPAGEPSDGYGSATYEFVRDERAFFLQPGVKDVEEGVLWSTDGSPAGTEPVLSRVQEVLAHDEDDLFVRRGDELWWTNGKTSGEEVSRRLGPFQQQLRTARMVAPDRVVVVPRVGEVIGATREEFVLLGDGVSFDGVVTSTHVFFRDQDCCG